MVKTQSTQRIRKDTTENIHSRCCFRLRYTTTTLRLVGTYCALLAYVCAKSICCWRTSISIESVARVNKARLCLEYLCTYSDLMHKISATFARFRYRICAQIPSSFASVLWPVQHKAVRFELCCGRSLVWLPRKAFSKQRVEHRV